MLLDKEAVINVAGWLHPEHFYEERHKLIYQNIVELFEEGIVHSIVSSEVVRLPRGLNYAKK